MKKKAVIIIIAFFCMHLAIGLGEILFPDYIYHEPESFFDFIDDEYWIPYEDMLYEDEDMLYDDIFPLFPQLTTEELNNLRLQYVPDNNIFELEP